MPLKVMIVEDEEIIALDLKDMLEDAGHTAVGHATSMGEAVALARKHKPQAAIVDIGLEGQSTGFDVAQELCSAHNVPVLFLTGRSDFLVRAMAMSVEPLGYIDKPYQPSEILDALATVR